MRMAIFDAGASAQLAQAVADRIGQRLGRRQIQRFPDGELHVQLLESVCGDDVYLVQSTAAPVEANLFALLLLADACRRAGAARITAVVPYMGYARQDRRASGRESVTIRVVADLLAAAGVERLVAVDLHSAALEAVFSMPLEHVSAVAALADAARPHVSEGCVLVAPDLGAVKLADRFAHLLGLPVAIVHKVRVSGEQVAVRRITGEVEGRRPLIVDDILSTGATIEAAAKALLAAGADADMMVLATHGLFAGAAAERLAGLPLRRILVTDSVSAPRLSQPLRWEVVSLAPLLAAALERLHANRSLDDLVVHV